MLTIIDKPGQLCNRLWAFSPFINNAIKNEYKVVILNFYDYKKYFENLETYENVVFVNEKWKANLYKMFFEILTKLPKGILKLFGVTYAPNQCVTKINPNKNFILIKGWDNKKPEEELRVDVLKKIFKPKLNYTQKVDNIFEEKKSLFDIIIAVHIRKGDYKNFRNGQYYYEDDTYSKYMAQIKSQLGDDKKIGFLICSNEKVSPENFKNFSIFQINDANLIEDLYGISKCDYIIGPPSSFSMWASLYGQKPLHFLTKPNLDLKLKDFDIISAQDTFKSGKTLDH